MKFGNTSQTQIPVPNFYLTKNVIEMEVFKTNNDMKSTFREKDLFRQTKDINLSNNFRNKQKLFEEYNKEKYIPIHKREAFYLKSLANSQIKPITSNKYVEDYDKFQNYLKKKDMTNYTNPNMRDGIRSNINTLLDRINSNFDLDKWNKIDSKPVFHKFIKETYSDITKYNQNNPNESEKFKNSLRDKLKTLGNFGSENNKENIMKTFSKFTDHKPIKKHIGFITSCRSSSVQEKKYDLTEEEKQIQIQNSSIYDKFKETTSYREYPSPTRTEFSKKVGEKYSYLRRMKNDENSITTEKYDSIKRKGIFSEDYSDTLQSLRRIVDNPDKIPEKFQSLKY